MEVHSAASEDSLSNLKEELKESIRSENFFLNKMETTVQKEDLNNQKSNIIRIETGEEAQQKT